MDEQKYYVPQNIRRDYTIGPFKILGLIEGIILGFIVYQLSGLIPIKYETVELAVRLSLTIGIFVLAARGIYTYSLTQYAIIIARYYIKRGDREYRIGFRKSVAKEKSTENYTQGMVIEEEIGDRIVRLKDGRYIGVVQVAARNLFSKSADERQAIVSNFTAQLRIMPVRAQIVTYTRSADPFEYVNSIKELTADITDASIRREIDDYLELCRSSIGFSTEEVTFLVVFSSDALDKSVPNKEVAMEQLRRCMLDFESYLAENGMASRLSSNPDIYKREISKILFRVYNPLTTVKNSKAYEVREKKVKQNFHLLNEEVKAKDIPLSYYLAPVVFDDSESPNYIFADNCYQSFYYIAQNTYPEISAGFLARLPHVPGLDYHLFYERIDGKAFLDRTNFAANMSRKMVNSGDNESKLRSELSSVYGSAIFLKDCYEKGNLPYYAGVLISIRANQYDKLLNIEEWLEKNLYRRGVTIVPCKYLQREAYLSTRLGNKVDPRLWKKMRQNMPETTLAAFYPFVETKMLDADPIFLGVTETSGAAPTAIMFNEFDTAHHDNANLIILGSSGKGKTFLCLLLALRLRILGYHVFIIAPIKGNEYDGLVRVMKGNTVRINSMSGQTINIMEIYPMVDESRGQYSSLLLSKVDSINAFVRFQMPDMTAVEAQILNNAIIETYGKFGITKENSSIWENKEKRIKKKMPILGDLVKVINEYAEKDSRAKDLATVMSVFTSGALSYFNNVTNIDLESGVTLFDLSTLSESTKSISMFAVTELIQSYCEMDITQKKVLLVDEVWMLLENEQSSKVVLEWARTIRGKGGSLISASQQLSDMFSVKAGGTLVAQAETKFYLGMNQEDLTSTVSAINLSREVQSAILDKPRGHGILLTRDDKTPLAILGSGHNMLTFSTDPTIVKVRNMITNKREELYVEQLLADGNKASEVERRFLKMHEEMLAEQEKARKESEEEISEEDEKILIELEETEEPEVRMKPQVRIRPEVRVKPQARIKPEVREKPAVRVKPEVRTKPQVRIKPEIRKGDNSHG